MDVDLIPVAITIQPSEEVMERDVVELGRGRVARDVSANPRIVVVGSTHHDGCVPADDLADAHLERHVARELRFALGRDRVDVLRRHQVVWLEAANARLVEQPTQQVACTFGAVGLEDALEREQPLLRLEGVRVDGHGRCSPSLGLSPR